MQRRVDTSQHTIRPKRAFFVVDSAVASYLDIAIAAGHVIEEAYPCGVGVLVVTDGGIPVNDSDHRGREDDAATCEDVVAASGASVGSALSGNAQCLTVEATGYFLCPRCGQTMSFCREGTGHLGDGKSGWLTCKSPECEMHQKRFALPRVTLVPFPETIGHDPGGQGTRPQ